MYLPEQLSASSSSVRGTNLEGKYISMARIPTLSGRDALILVVIRQSRREHSLNIAIVTTSCENNAWENSRERVK